LPEISADERNGLGPRLRRLIEDMREEWRSIDQRITVCGLRIFRGSNTPGAKR